MKSSQTEGNTLRKGKSSSKNRNKRENKATLGKKPNALQCRRSRKPRQKPQKNNMENKPRKPTSTHAAAAASAAT